MQTLSTKIFTAFVFCFAVFSFTIFPRAFAYDACSPTSLNLPCTYGANDMDSYVYDSDGDRILFFNSESVTIEDGSGPDESYWQFITDPSGTSALFDYWNSCTPTLQSCNHSAASSVAFFATAKPYYTAGTFFFVPEDSGTIIIISPANDSNIDGSAFVMEIDYWNYGSGSAPYNQIYCQITDSDENVIDIVFEDIETDNVTEEKTVFIPKIVLGSYPDAILTCALYNSNTQDISDTEQQTFNIYTSGAIAQYYNYYLDFLSTMDYIDSNPTKTYNNTNDQEIVVSASIGDISCDDIVEGHFDYNSYTNSSFTVVDSVATINRFVKGGLYLDCRDNEVFLYLKVEPENPGPVYYQIDFFDDTGQTDKLSFLRFAILYDVDEGVVGGVEFQDPNQNFFCDDMTIYLPNYIGDPFEIKVLNKICSAIFAPPAYYSNQFNRVDKVFRDKTAFVFMIQTKYNSVQTAIASGSTSPPEMTSGSWNGASFNLQDMFAGSTSFMPWVRTYMGVVMWIAFVAWMLRDVKEFFATKEVGENNY